MNCRPSSSSACRPVGQSHTNWCRHCHRRWLSAKGTLMQLPHSVGELRDSQTQLYGHWRSWLPAGIGGLKSLKTLEISHCRSMKTLSETAKELGSLEELKLKSRTSLKELPAGVGLEDSEALRLPRHATTPNTRDGSGVPFLCLSGVSR